LSLLVPFGVVPGRALLVLPVPNKIFFFTKSRLKNMFRGTAWYVPKRKSIIK
jgi:hypothetical protein